MALGMSPSSRARSRTTVGIRQRHGGQQGARVGMARIAEELVGRRRLHDLAEVHYGDAIGDVFHNREIVADEDVGEPEALLQGAHQVDDLRLDRHVERRDGLVGHDQLGLDGERAGDRQPLALAAGEFVRIAAGVLGAQSDQFQELADAGLARRFALGKAMQHQRLAQHGAHRHARIERGVGVLEDHLHALAARAHLVVGERQQVLALEAHLAGRGLDQAQHQAADRRLAAARFAHDGQRLAGLELEIDAVDGADMARHQAEGAAPHGKVLGEAGDFQERAHWITCASGARRQRVRCPGATSTSGGVSVRQAGSTKGQRAAKRQPSGGRLMSGTRPSIEGRRSRFSSSRGIEPRRPTV